jgi:hypothetical protein
MAESSAEIADRVFTSVLSPLVLGGRVQPSRPIGARAALALAREDVRPLDMDLASRVDLARVAQARRLAPVDRVPSISGAAWSLGAALHDLLQSASPAWVRRSAPRRLLDLVQATIERVPRVTSAAEALDRHTWLARTLSIARKDTSISWWVGSREFRGEDPPKRLLAWPEIRRVNVDAQRRKLVDLLAHGGKAEHAPLFESALTLLLRATPLTDLAACARLCPLFAWSPQTVALARSPAARTLALRALAASPADDVDAALGRATRELLELASWEDASPAVGILAQRALAGAQTTPGWPGPLEGADDAAFARAAGALVARRWLDSPESQLPEAERRRLAPILDSAARVSVAKELARVQAEQDDAKPSE